MKTIVLHLCRRGANFFFFVKTFGLFRRKIFLNVIFFKYLMRYKIFQAQIIKISGLATSVSGLTTGVNSLVVRASGPATESLTLVAGSPALAIKSKTQPPN